MVSQAQHGAPMCPRHISTLSPAGTAPLVNPEVGRCWDEGAVPRDDTGARPTTQSRCQT